VLAPQIFGVAPDGLPAEVERLPLEPAQGGSDVSRRFNALLECVAGPYVYPMPSCCTALVQLCTTDAETAQFR
jgi:hypothetical protein